MERREAIEARGAQRSVEFFGSLDLCFLLREVDSRIIAFDLLKMRSRLNLQLKT
jgi:hypothetical protein